MMLPLCFWHAISPRKIEDEMEYPGQIKVVIIRELVLLITQNNEIPERAA